MKEITWNKETQAFSEAVGRALRRAAKAARKTAKMYGMPIYVWESGKVVGEETVRSLIYHTPGLSHVCCHQLLSNPSTKICPSSC